MLKKVKNSKRKKIKIVDVITEQKLHVCTKECFEPRKSQKPRGLRKISLGHIYQDDVGRCYHKWKDGDWLEVVGITFAVGSGGLHLLFEPKEQLHIHSPGGKTVALTKTQRDAKVTDEYHSIQAAKKLKRKGFNRRDSLKKISLKVTEIIPKAAKSKKPVKGTGRGAFGIPRTPLTKKIVELINQGKQKERILQEIIDWAKANSIKVAGPYQLNIKKQVNRWWDKIKSAQK